MRVNTVKALALMCVIMMLAACGGIRYSRVSDDIKDFHPASIGVLPVDEGAYVEATDVADGIIAGVLQEKAWFPTVVPPDKIRAEMIARSDVQDMIVSYLDKLDKLNFSDPELSKKIGIVYGIDVFLVAGVDSWTYTTAEGDKVARVGLSMILVQAETGMIVWRAGHHTIKDYWFIKPDLQDLARTVVGEMLDEMPH
ncbi:MAG: hypothetical protein NT072_02755 [Deltaproteobacteria bacterium]|nr:hypothetical protein [Deltaproteobacteria bacterium]